MALKFKASDFIRLEDIHMIKRYFSARSTIIEGQDRKRSIITSQTEAHGDY
jgi:hypothetical protein